MKTVVLSDFLTDEQINQAWKLYCEAAPGTFAKRCLDEVVQPNWDQIGGKLGGVDQNDPKYWCYAIEYVFNQVWIRSGHD